jgi:hypothetical protein
LKAVAAEGVADDREGGPGLLLDAVEEGGSVVPFGKEGRDAGLQVGGDAGKWGKRGRIRGPIHGSFCIFRFFA